MIFIFILYFIFLIWLFEFIDIYDDFNINMNPDQKVTIIIDYNNTLNDIFLTIDSLKLQDYNLNNINLIIIDESNNDFSSLLDNYKYIFSSIDIIKASNISKIDALHSIENICHDYILFVENGVSISKRFVASVIKYLDQSGLSIIFLPLMYRYQNQYHIFYQLYQAFIESIRCSLINKNFNLSAKNMILKKEAFHDLINRNHINISAQYLVEKDLCLYMDKNSHLNINSNINIIHMLYSVINFIFIFSLLQFIAFPDKYFLAIIIIKIIPELCFVYTFYNRLAIKFPKLDFLIFSLVGPFYSLIELIHNQISIKNQK
tara:strand:+ start:3168 stop:4121 length:954 start_codon:yes stop_codon:yes gene_type:complete